MIEHNRRAADQLLSPIIDANTPWYWKLAVQVAFWFGPTVIVAAVFIGMWTGWLSSPITENQKILMRVETKIDHAVASMKDRVLVSMDRDESQLRVLLVICRNSAPSPAQRLQCDDYWKR